MCHVSQALRTAANQHPRNPNVTQRLRDLQRRHALVSPRLNIRPLLHQHLRHVSMPRLHCAVQRTVPLLIPRVHVAASLQQNPNSLHPPLETSPVERRPPVLVPSVHHRAALDQPLDAPHLPPPRRRAQPVPEPQRVKHARMPVLRRHVVRCPTREVPHVLVRPFLQQQLHHLLVAHTRRHVQTRITLSRVANVGSRVVRQQHPHEISLAMLHCKVQRGFAVFGQRVNIRAFE
ncbi:hypothetical protein VIGAN_04244300 [Vigna angularis var. angularis]|uniref:Uncharacterized protein n=1 Tax=Vigna angularis var. angularis TaxID=157739 RepID=A0A0S3RWM3_PHAAN|nr:hypothetical protein VIGAN_04244300 [Vigna angularis var. angularis]